jgi:hypothetical protein
MTNRQYRDALARLGLTQAAAVRLIGIDERTSRRWARDGVPGSSRSVAILLRLLLAGMICEIQSWKFTMPTSAPAWSYRSRCSRIILLKS